MPKWGLTWPHLGLVLTAKMRILCGRGCIFEHFNKFVLRRPRWAPDGLQTLQRGPKMAPRGPQEEPKRAPGSIYKSLATVTALAYFINELVNYEMAPERKPYTLNCKLGCYRELWVCKFGLYKFCLCKLCVCVHYCCELGCCKLVCRHMRCP